MYMRKGFIAIYTTNIEDTKDYLTRVRGIDDVRFDLYEADILATVQYEDEDEFSPNFLDPNEINEEVNKRTRSL